MPPALPGAWREGGRSRHISALALVDRFLVEIDARLL